MNDTEVKTVKTKEEEMMMIYRSFQMNLDSLKSFVDTLSPVAFEKDSNQAEEVTIIIKNAFTQIGIEIPEDGKIDKESGVTMDKEQLFFFAKQLRKIPKISVGHSRILYQSSFVLLVGYFEYLFADLLKFYYKHYPGNISDKPIQVIINELKSYDTVEDAVDYVISKEVEMILFDLTFNELIDFFNKQLKINLESNLLNWSLINETRERRHIIVHNNAIINKKYLKKSKTDFLPDKDDLKIGEKISVHKDYFYLAFNEIYATGHLLIFNCWRQWIKSDTKKIYGEIMNTSFECLKQDLNNIARCISLYSTTIEAKSDEELDYLLRAKFNYLIALKQLEKNDELETQLSQMKVSTLSPIFKMAYYALKEEKEKLLETIPHCKLVDKMKIEWVHEWPLFKHIRKDKEFIQQIEEKFNAK